MTNETVQMLERALHLDPQERAFLAEQLLASLDEEEEFPLSEDWKREIARRCKEIDNGEVELIPAEEVFKEAYDSLE